jgi:hypothetical protein
VTNYADRLAIMDAAYDAAPMAGGVDDLPPDGEYQVVIDRFDFIESKKNNRLYLKTISTVAIGPHTGRTISTLHDLEDPDRLKQLKRHLSVLEVEPVSLRHLETSLQDALDVPFLVAVKTNGEYRNVYFNQKLGAAITRDVPKPAAERPAGQAHMQQLDSMKAQSAVVQSAIDDNIPF